MENLNILPVEEMKEFSKIRRKLDDIWGSMDSEAYSRIAEDALNGQDSTMLDKYTISDKEIQYLRDLGYTVECDEYDDVFIYW